MSTPLPTDQDRLSSLSASILTAVELSALELGIGLPDKRYITAGQAAHDCPQVAVVLTSLQTGLPDSSNSGGGAFPAGSCQPIWTAIYTVEILQEAPLWPEDNSGVVPAAPITAWFNDFVSPMTAVLTRAIDKLADSPTNFGEVSSTITYPEPSGGFEHIYGNYSLVLP